LAKKKNLSVSAPSVPTEQLSTSILQTIEVGVKRVHVV